MKRIVLHWTAGTHKASSLDRQHYHLMIQGDGSVVYGDKPVSANAAPLSSNYAAHTRGLNTDSIGVAVCAMHDAQQSPFDPGKYPITDAQIARLVKEVARLATGYGIPVTRQTILSHAEVQPTLGVQQSGKWDIAWLPGRSKANDPIGCGDYLRGLIADQINGAPPVRPDAPASVKSAPATNSPALAGGVIAAIVALVAAYLGLK